MTHWFKRQYDKVIQYSKLIELVCILSTLGVIAFQTAQTNDHLTEMKKIYSLDISKMVHEHKQRINNVLIEDQNEGLRKRFDLNKEEVLYFIMINDFANLHRLNLQHLIDGSVWKEVEKMIVGQMTHFKPLNAFWHEKKNFFDAAFVAYANGFLPSTPGRAEGYEPPDARPVDKGRADEQ